MPTISSIPSESNVYPFILLMSCRSSSRFLRLTHTVQWWSRRNLPPQGKTKSSHPPPSQLHGTQAMFKTQSYTLANDSHLVLVTCRSISLWEHSNRQGILSLSRGTLNVARRHPPHSFKREPFLFCTILYNWVLTSASLLTPQLHFLFLARETEALKESTAIDSHK